MTSPKFRYLIITEDDDVFGTNDLARVKQYFRTIIDLEKNVVRWDEYEEQIEEAPTRSDDSDGEEGPDA